MADDVPQFPQYPQSAITVDAMPKVRTKTFTDRTIHKPLLKLANQMLRIKGKSTRLHQRKKVKVL